jgi:hypothetical protein
MGPFYWEGAPDLPRGSNLAEGVKGEPALHSGRVLSEDGRPHRARYVCQQTDNALQHSAAFLRYAGSSAIH